MRVIDPDAHFFEPLDWLNYVDPELAAQLPPPRPFAEVLINNIAQGILAGREIDDPAEAVSIENRFHSMKTAVMQPMHQEGASESELAYFDAAARIDLCDAEGVDIQFLNPTMGLSQLSYQIKESGHPELMPRSLVAYNSWAADQVHGFTDRLMPVTQTDTSDIEATIAEMTRIRDAGSRAFQLPRNKGKISYTHPDYDPMWSAAEDLGMAAYLHIQFGTPVDPTYANNGRGLETFSHLSGLLEAAATRQFLMAMVFDGVFERHPRLRLILAECGYSWFPAFLFDIDAKTSKFGMDGLPHENFYKLPLMPSEYIRRQVRLTLISGFILSGMERLTIPQALEQLPDPDLLVFSSDFPHVEGLKSAIPFFQPLLPPDEAIHESFFGGSIAEFAGL